LDNGVRRMGVAQPVDRCGGIDAGALSCLLDDEIDGALGQGLPGRRTDGSTGEDGNYKWVKSEPSSAALNS
jgi:hypothetical protein